MPLCAISNSNNMWHYKGRQHVSFAKIDILKTEQQLIYYNKQSNSNFHIELLNKLISSQSYQFRHLHPLKSKTSVKSIQSIAQPYFKSVSQKVLLFFVF